MLAADVDHALFRIVIRPQLALVPRHNRFPQRQDAPRRRVLRVIFLDRVDRRLLDVLRRGKIRLARPEVGDVHALGLQLLGFSDYRRCR